MPFTFSHPVFILPFLRQQRLPLSATGLIAGAMAPDFEYFMKFRAAPEIGEWPWGQYLFNLPLAVISVFVFHVFVKQALIRHLPAPFDRHFASFLHFSFLEFLATQPGRFIFSLLLGMTTHLLADWLLYPQGPLEDVFNLLPTLGGVQPAIFIERTISSLGLLYFSWLFYHVASPGFRGSGATAGNWEKLLYWMSVCVITLILATQKFIAPGFTQSLVSGLACLLFGLSATSIGWKLFWSKKCANRETSEKSSAPLPHVVAEKMPEY